jgi:hypothetical protein
MKVSSEKPWQRSFDAPQEVAPPCGAGNRETERLRIDESPGTLEVLCLFMLANVGPRKKFSHAPRRHRRIMTPPYRWSQLRKGEDCVVPVRTVNANELQVVLLWGTHIFILLFFSFPILQPTLHKLIMAHRTYPRTTQRRRQSDALRQL